MDSAAGAARNESNHQANEQDRYQVRSLLRSRPPAWLTVIFFAATLSQAQITTTTLLGTVTDSTGAFVSGAQITLTNTDTNLARSVRSEAEGAYRLELLPVGNYQMEVRCEGFRTYVQKEIVLTNPERQRSSGCRADGRNCEREHYSDGQSTAGGHDQCRDRTHRAVARDRTTAPCCPQPIYPPRSYSGSSVEQRRRGDGECCNQ